MIKNVIGAIAGAQLAPKNNAAAGSVGGALAASAIPFVLRRLSIPGMLLLGGAGYLINKQREKRGEGIQSLMDNDNGSTGTSTTASTSDRTTGTLHAETAPAVSSMNASSRDTGLNLGATV